MATRKGTSRARKAAKDARMVELRVLNEIKRRLDKQRDRWWYEPDPVWYDDWEWEAAPEPGVSRSFGIFQLSLFW